MNKQNKFTPKGLQILIDLLQNKSTNVDDLVNRNKNIRFNKVHNKDFMQQKSDKMRKSSVDVKDRKPRYAKEDLTSEAMVKEVRLSIQRKKESQFTKTSEPVQNNSEFTKDNAASGTEIGKFLKLFYIY